MAENRLQTDAEEHYREIADALPCPACIGARQKRSWCFNRRWLEFTGIAEKCGPDELALSAVHPEDRDQVLEKLSGRFEQESSAPFEFRMRRHDDEYVWFRAWLRPVPGESADDRVLFTCVDIQSEKRAQAELRKGEARKDEFLAILAHEIRNPLASISAGVNLLNHPRTNQERAAFVKETMKQRVHQLARLIDDLLDVSRIAQGKISLVKERLPVSLFVERSAEVVREAMEERGHRFDVMIDENVFVNGDPARLEQIVVNLLLNSVKYTEPGGRIELIASREDNDAIIKVRDNGIGIAPEVLPGIFEMFGQADKTLHRGQGGLGLGLTLVRKLVEMHEGSISVRSEGIGQGTEFTVTLPLAPELGARIRPASEGEDVEEGLHVLIIEDHRDTAIMSAALLQMHGHMVEVAYDGPSGLEAALQTRPDVVILDLGLPGLSGYEVARSIRQKSGFSPLILAVTGYGQSKDFERSREAGIDYHFLKPIDYDAMLPVLSEWRRKNETLGKLVPNEGG